MPECGKAFHHQRYARQVIRQTDPYSARASLIRARREIIAALAVDCVDHNQQTGNRHRYHGRDRWHRPSDNVTEVASDFWVQTTNADGALFMFGVLSITNHASTHLLCQQVWIIVFSESRQLPMSSGSQVLRAADRHFQRRISRTRKNCIKPVEAGDDRPGGLSRCEN